MKKSILQSINDSYSDINHIYKDLLSDIAYINYKKGFDDKLNVKELYNKIDKIYDAYTKIITSSDSMTIEELEEEYTKFNEEIKRNKTNIDNLIRILNYII
jgi:hypothetical protein